MWEGELVKGGMQERTGGHFLCTSIVVQLKEEIDYRSWRKCNSRMLEGGDEGEKKNFPNRLADQEAREVGQGINRGQKTLRQDEDRQKKKGRGGRKIPLTGGKAKEAAFLKGTKRTNHGQS